MELSIVRLWQRLFLAFAALSGAALLGFVTWQQANFRRGFLNYLDDVAVQRLDSARTRLAAAYARRGDWSFLRDDPAAFGELVDPGPWRWGRSPGDGRPADRGGPGGRSEGEDAGPPRPEPPDRPPAPVRHGPPGGVPPERQDPGFGDEGDGPHGPHRFHGPPDLMRRLLLVDAGGTPVAGNRTLPADAIPLPVVLDGRTIGTLRLARIAHINAAVDIAFSRTQSRDALVVGAAILIAALLFAFALARWLLAPVRALTAGTRALAAGDFHERVPDSRGDELGALAQDFNRLAAALEQNRDARRRWGADIAHELRTPLSVLRGEIQALQDGIRQPSPQALASLHAECERLGSLIEDLYQLALADAGALDYRFAPVDLRELVDDCVDAQRAACADAGIALEADTKPTPPVRGDARRLGQLVDNLLVNARRYTDAAGRIRLALDVAAGQAVLIVDDTPPGVPAASLPHLFERLYRVDASRVRHAGGAGLGLSICRAIADAHGATISARQSPLGGLRIVVQLPLAEAAR